MISPLDRAIMKSIDESDVPSLDFDIENNRHAEETKSEDALVHYTQTNNKCYIFWDKLIVITIFGAFVMPFALLDLIYAYTDTSCIYIYPEKLAINMQNYLEVCGYTSTLLFVYKTIIICRNKGHGEIDMVDLLIRQEVLQFIVRCALIVWNIIGAFIFWGELYTNTPCSKNVFNYLFVSIIIKLCGSLLFYVNTRNSIQIGNEIP